MCSNCGKIDKTNIIGATNIAKTTINCNTHVYINVPTVITVKTKPLNREANATINLSAILENPNFVKPASLFFLAYLLTESVSPFVASNAVCSLCTEFSGNLLVSKFISLKGSLTMTLNNCVFKALIVLSDTLSFVVETLAVKLVVEVFSVVSFAIVTFDKLLIKELVKVSVKLLVT